MTKSKRMSDWYAALDRKIFYPMYYWRAKDPRMAHLRLLEQRQYWDKSTLAAWQLDRLQRLISHAYQTTGFYKDLYDRAGVKPADLQTLADLQRFPCVSKRDLQHHGESLISDQYSVTELVKDSSGGSTGVPTNFYKDRRQYQLRAADQIRHDRWTGWDIGQPFGLIWGAQKDIKAISSWKQRIVTQYIHRILPLDAFELTDDKMKQYMQNLEQVQPPMVLGYANALGAFASFLLEHFPQHQIRPRGVISSAEALSEQNRQKIEAAFHCRVFNRYGSREVGLIASECSAHEGLHINADNVLVELGIFNLSDPNAMTARIPALAEPGQSAEVIVTDFWNYGMPFIRYRMGDEASASEQACSCGRSLPLLQEVRGRCSDFIVAVDGRRIHGEYFTHLFYHNEAVQQFQLIQESLNHLILKIVFAAELKKSEIDAQQQRLISGIREVLGATVKVEVQECERIEPSASGKYLFTLSKIIH